MLRTYTASDLYPLQTITVGQCCDLRRETSTQRVWLCRVGGGVTVETLHKGRWQIASGSCTETSAKGK